MAMLRRAEVARRTRRDALAAPSGRPGLRPPGSRAATTCPAIEWLSCAPTSGSCPLVDGAVAGALSLNVLDCVPSPVAHLCELGRVVGDGGAVLLSTPYDWATNAATMEHWLGGHSQRGEQRGASEPELRRLLSPERAAGIDTGLTIAAERDDVPWLLTLNARSVMHYRLHLLRLARTARAA
jgi:hypothetical protein